MTLSVCIIARNEEKTIGRILECAKGFADEIIVVDTGSDDMTKSIASKYTDKLYDFEWIDDFSKARNYSFSKAVGDYIMWLDADDFVDSENSQKIKELKKTLGKHIDTVFMKYAVAFDESGKPLFSYERERIVKNCRSAFWQGRVHEVIVPFGGIIHENITIEHRKIVLPEQNNHRNLNIYLGMIRDGVDFSPRERYYYARELMYSGNYKEAVFEFNKLLNDKNVWKENLISAHTDLADCYYRLGEKEKCIKALIMSLEIAPRAENLCRIGNYALENKSYKDAIFWYKSALLCEKDYSTGGFVYDEYYDYIPYIQLCVCYDRIGDYKKAKEYNSYAYSVRPGSKEVSDNIKYFDEIGL